MYVNNKIVDGLEILITYDMKIKEKANYKDGYLEGEKITYNSKGNIESKSLYVNNKEEESTEYDENSVS